MGKRCEYVHASGRRCQVFALNGLEPVRCLFHTAQSVIKAQTPAWDLRRQINILHKELSSLRHVKDDVIRIRLTLETLAMLDKVEGKITERRFGSLSLAERIKEVEKRQK